MCIVKSTLQIQLACFQFDIWQSLLSKWFLLDKSHCRSCIYKCLQFPWCFCLVCSCSCTKKFFIFPPTFVFKLPYFFDFLSSVELAGGFTYCRVNQCFHEHCSVYSGYTVYGREILFENIYFVYFFYLCALNVLKYVCYLW